MEWDRIEHKIKIYDGQISLNDSLIQKNTLKIDKIRDEMRKSLDS